MPKKIIIIGGGTAGASAAFAARKADRKAEITVLEQESYPTYSRCGLPFAIKGIIPSLENLIVFPDKFFRQQKINHIKEVTVKKIIPDKKTVVADQDYNYDSLVITAGSSPVKLPIPGIDLPHVLTLRTINDAKKIIESAQSSKSAVVIGASFIGIEVAEALKSKGCEVTLVEAARTMWRVVDEDIGRLINQHLTEQGIKILEKSLVTGIEEKKVLLKDQTIEADIIIVSAGVKPNVTLAKEAGLDIGQTGGIKVNERLESNLKDIYAAGDCAEVVSALTGEPILIGLGTIAARQGVVAGANAIGGDKKAPPVLNSSILKTFGLEIGSVGFTEQYLREKQSGKLDPVSMLIKYPSLPHYYPGGVDIHIKLMADKKTHRLIGAQLLGKTSIAPRINTLALAVEKGMTIEELTQSDFCYSPPVADVWDPIAIAAQAVSRKLEKI